MSRSRIVLTALTAALLALPALADEVTPHYINVPGTDTKLKVYGFVQGDGRHAAHHDELALRKVNHATGVVDHRKAEPDQRVHGADRKPGHDDLQKCTHAGPPELLARPPLPRGGREQGQPVGLLEGRNCPAS